MKDYRYIEIKEGNEYHALVDSTENIYSENNFFHPVYAKSAKLVKEICKNSIKESNKIGKGNELEHKDFSNNIIMYCAERGGGKSTAMMSFANTLKNFCEEKSKDSENFKNMWGNFPENPSFSVLSVIDPTEISESDLFLRIIFSKMFSKLSSKWDEEDKKMYSGAYPNEDAVCRKMSRNKITQIFTECYRYLDVIYQKKGKFEYDDDLDDLTNLGDSGKLKEKFWELVRNYLEEMTGFKEKSNFLVIQIDDADLNSGVTYKMIEDIRKYCIIPNVIILMSVNIAQMHYVLEQNFVSDFKMLLDISNVENRDGDAKSIHLHDCQKMAMRYIDKIMPAAHQIHLPKTEDFINSNTFDLKISYDIIDENDASKIIKLLELKDKDDNYITDYQEIFIHLIYKKTGIVIVKPDGYLHNILPKTMRGLSHFLAYMRQLPDLDKDLGIAEIQELLTHRDEAFITEINEKYKIDAERELRKRIDNLEALKLYFLKNWCTVRLTKRYQDAVADIDRAVVEMKVKTASSWIDRLFGENFKFGHGDAPLFSTGSYAFLCKKLQRLTLRAHSMEDSSGIYHFVYALRFYFMLEFNRAFLSYVKNGRDYENILKLTDCEMWAPSVALLDENDPGTNFGHFKVNSGILEKYNLSEDNNTDNSANNQKNDSDISSEESEVQTEMPSTIYSAILESNRYNYIVRRHGENYFFTDHKECNKEIDSMPNDGEIVVDLGACLLRDLLHDSFNNDKIETNLLNLNYKNCLIALLSSWELQRYAEKRSMFVFKEEYDLDKIHRQFVQEIFGCLNEIKYLPIDWDFERNKETDSLLMNSDISDLMLASKELIPFKIKRLFESLKKKMRYQNSKDIKPKQVGDILTSLLDNKISIIFELDQLSILSAVSDMAADVHKAGEKIQAVKGSEEISVFENNLKEWLDLINDDEVVNLITKQAVDNFDDIRDDSDIKKEPNSRIELVISGDYVNSIVTALGERTTENGGASNPNSSQ